MSYDLAFWKQKPSCSAAPSRIYEELLDGITVDGLDTLQTSEFITRIQQRFPEITTDGGLTFWEGKERGLFEVYSSDQHVHFCCRGMTGDDMNLLIDVAAEFECPLYDPQDDVRYDGGST